MTLMNCYITRTGSFLPGRPIDNDAIERYLGIVEGEEKVKRQVLTANGIQSRYYALNEDQTATHDVYQLAAREVENCVSDAEVELPIMYQSPGRPTRPSLRLASVRSYTVRWQSKQSPTLRWKSTQTPEFARQPQPHSSTLAARSERVIMQPRSAWAPSTPPRS